MTKPSAASFLGVAKDNLNTTLAASAAAGATSVTVASAAGITTASTIVIVDGPLTETRAVSAVASNVLTVAALTNAHNANTYVYAQPTASLGPTDYIPIKDFDFEDHVGKLEDQGLRGSNVDSYGSVDGVTHSEISIGGDVFVDSIGYLLGNLLGAVDFTGGTPNTFAMSVKNTGDMQPVPAVLYDFDAINARAFSRARVAELGFKLDPAGLLSWTAKLMAHQSGVVATPTSSFSSLSPVAAWTASPSLNGTAIGSLLDLELSFKRSLTIVDTADGSQTPYAIHAGPVTLDGKATFVMEDDTILNYFLQNTQPAFSIPLSTGTGASLQAITFQLTKANLLTGKPDRGKDFVAVPVTFKAIPNTTDATTAGTGYSPAKVTLRNTKATGVYQ